MGKYPPSVVYRKFYVRFWQFNPALAGMKRINGCENTNIEIRNPKQYQNTNVRNSKQMRSGTVAFRFCH
jgi:hypothetical protein